MTKDNEPVDPAIYTESLTEQLHKINKEEYTMVESNVDSKVHSCLEQKEMYLQKGKQILPY